MSLVQFMRSRTIAEAITRCDHCDAEPGEDCPGPAPHPERCEQARLQWWGPDRSKWPIRADNKYSVNLESDSE